MEELGRNFHHYEKFISVIKLDLVERQSFHSRTFL